MKVTVIYGTQKKSCTYNITKQFLKSLKPIEELKEFFLPRDLPMFCRGCLKCFEDHLGCPDYQYIKPILEAIIESDLLIFTSPVYVYHMTGQMKVLLDHFGFQWMAHQPNEAMFHKQALIIASAAGAGTKSTIRGIKDSLDFWGIAQTYGYGQNVAAASWEHITDKKKLEIEKDVKRLTEKIKGKQGKVRPSLKVKAIFYVMRFFHKRFGFNPLDVAYWENKGWLKNKRPW